MKYNCLWAKKESWSYSIINQSGCLSVCLSVCLSDCISVCLSVSSSEWERETERERERKRHFGGTIQSSGIHLERKNLSLYLFKRPKIHILYFPSHSLSVHHLPAFVISKFRLNYKRILISKKNERVFQEFTGMCSFTKCHHFFGFSCKSREMLPSLTDQTI